MPAPFEHLAAFVLLACLVFVPISARCQEPDSDTWHRVGTAPPKLEKLNINVQHPPSKGPVNSGPGPKQLTYSAASEDVKDAFVFLFQELGFSTNRAGVENPLEPVREWGSEQDACWTDIQEIQPERAFQVDFKSLNLPIEKHTHYGFQIAARWHESHPARHDKTAATSIPHEYESHPKESDPLSSTVGVDLALIIYARGDRDSWPDDIDKIDYNSKPVLDWIDSHIRSLLEKGTH
jgi:hypothetical protein